MPFSAALKFCFIKPSAMLGPLARRLASAIVTSGSSRSGTTAFTKPSASAWLAFKGSPV